MPQNNITNSTPRVILNGIDDESILPLVPQAQITPIHLPLFYLQAPTGPVDDVVLIMPGDLTRIYGDDMINYRKPYLNHAALLAQKILGEGNSIYVKRVVRDGLVNGVSTPATAGNLTLVCKVDTTTPIYQYARNPDGTVQVDGSGNPIYMTPQTPIVGGITLTYSWVPLAGAAITSFNTPFVSGGHTIYPLLTVQGAFPGDLSNSTGVRLWTAGINTVNPGDIDVITDQQALIFEMQIVFKPVNGSPIVVNSVLGENNVQFCFKPGAYNYKTNADLTIQNLVTNWNDDGMIDGLSPTFGPIGSVTVHEANLETMLGLLLTAENANRQAPLSSIWMLDFLTGISSDGTAHYGFQIDKTGSILNSASTYMMLEGFDGDLTDATFETAVINEINNNYANPAYPLIDSAKFPFSCLYDSGFSNNADPTLSVKKTLFKWTSLRKDVHVCVGTHTVGQPQLSISDEMSIGADLKSAAAIYSESALWGTPACRIVIMMQSGELVNDPFTQPVSTVFDLAIKRARYMGAGSGVMKSGLGYDKSPANQVTLLKNISNTFITDFDKAVVWLKGLNYCQSFDHRSYFFAAIQTIYGIENSVLTGDVLMQICVDVEKQSEIVWRMLTGNSDLSDAEFIKEANKLLLSLVDGRYDNRVTIVPNTYFTAADSARGYSWTQDNTVYGNVPRTVASVNVITRRQVVTGA